MELLKEIWCHLFHAVWIERGRRYIRKDFIVYKTVCSKCGHKCYDIWFAD